MLRSELENMPGSVKDAAAWEAPDFFALAFYLIREEKDTLADMEKWTAQSVPFGLSERKFYGPLCRQHRSSRVKEDMDAFIRMIHAIYN